MCGIAGIFQSGTKQGISEETISRMLSSIRHRGPDEFGIYLDHKVGLGNARLSIVDLAGGQQPICNEDGTLWIVFNGEIFNHVELRPLLEERGHSFATSSDTEVLLHLYEEYGPACLEKLNGQFAFAIWNERDETLFLARDRMGVRPLFYTQQDGRLIFGSEIKAIFSVPGVARSINPNGLEEVFTVWAPLPSHTVFRGVYEIPPGHYAIANSDGLKITPYWQIAFESSETHDAAGYVEKLGSLLIDAVQVRLRADVPVGAYLSGGLDSSAIAAIVREFTRNQVDTFSITFGHSGYDESCYQQRMANFLGTQHHVIHAEEEDIAAVFPEVIWHTEMPLMRSSAAPMFLLAKLVRASGYKVVLTGEGADEILAGYDIFKEAKIRRFWARNPESSFRPNLLHRLYPDIQGLAKSNIAFLAGFFRDGLCDVNEKAYSHAIRWRNNRRTCRFFSDCIRAELDRSSASLVDRISFPPQFEHWGPLERAQYLEMSIFLPQYLLSSQGDRMGMAHGIEGRFPFLDYRVVEFCSRVPSHFKLRGLTDKYLLKKLATGWLPDEIVKRPKRPYRAPIHSTFFSKGTPEYVRELLSPDMLHRTGLFNSKPVGLLVAKGDSTRQMSEVDEMAIVGILSTQLLHQKFIEHFDFAVPLAQRDRVKLCTSHRLRERAHIG